MFPIVCRCGRRPPPGSQLESNRATAEDEPGADGTSHAGDVRIGPRRLDGERAVRSVERQIPIRFEAQAISAVERLCNHRGIGARCDDEVVFDQAVDPVVRDIDARIGMALRPTPAPTVVTSPVPGNVTLHLVEGPWDESTLSESTRPLISGSLATIPIVRSAPR